MVDPTKVEVLEIVKDELTRSRHPQTSRNPTFYPSSAAVTTESGTTYGACSRADWYRLCGVKPTDSTELYMIMTYHLGKAIELKVVEGMKQAGIYEGEGTKFFIPKFNVSGELDIVGRYRRDDRSIGYYGVEIKSVYSMGATATISGRQRAWKGQPAFDPYPKESNLMQVMIYLGEFFLSDRPEKKLEFFKLIYIPRDKPVAGREYTITLVTSDMLSGSMKARYADKMVDGEYYALVQTQGFQDKIETRFSLEAIHRNYEQNLALLRAREIFPRAFQKFYSEETIETMYAEGTLGKTAYEDWLKAGKPAASLEKTPGHYLCQSYCEWRSFCYNRNGTPNPAADAVTFTGEFNG